MTKATGVPMADLGADQCRWPTTADDVTRSEHKFCGRPAAPGKPYCRAHAALAYGPAQAPAHAHLDGAAHEPPASGDAHQCRAKTNLRAHRPGGRCENIIASRSGPAMGGLF